jgi:hypothetical protein
MWFDMLGKGLSAKQLNPKANFVEVAFGQWVSRGSAPEGLCR